jgi:poly(A) polymerase
MLASPSFLDDAKVKRIFDVFDGAGEETRAVGGALRNALLGVPVSDVDFATTALPQITMDRAKAANLRAVPTGFDHGTVTVIVEGQPFEITTLREDVETDGRRAKVLFGRDFEQDALRRDFTINALSCDRAGRIFDYADGLADMDARRVRFIGDAQQRVREDYLRILRFFRFHAAYGEGPLDAQAFHAAVIEREGMHNLSRERIRAELLKLLGARHCAPTIAIMCGAGLLLPVLAGIAIPARLARVIDIESARGATADPVLRLIALCVLVREDAERLRAELRLSNAEAQRALEAARALETLHGCMAPPEAKTLRAFLYPHGREAARDALMLAQAEAGASAHASRWASADAFLAQTPKPRLPFSGADLLARGVAPGRGMGEALKTIEALWVGADFPDDPATLARLLDEALTQHS